ncbi:MAG: hypothetical protein GEU73_05060 [Chloroflexi bacterium]|nr:hypothetical protein [Chloroflexota bacterium]
MKTCDVCDRTDAGYALPAGITFHCEICHQSLSGRTKSEIHCHDIDDDGNVTGCGRSFGGRVAFDAHIGPNKTCRDPDCLKREDGTPRFHATRRKGATVWVQARLGGPYRPPEPESPRLVPSTPRRKQGDAA